MKIVILGITGSIGKQTAQIVDQLKNKIRIVGASYNTNHVFAKHFIDKYEIKYVLCESDKNKSSVKSIDDLLRVSKPDLVVNAVSGFAGLKYSIAILSAKINLALANKESIVVAGKMLFDLAKNNGVEIIPIDSEHSAVKQLLINEKNKISDIYITASGGPFYNYSEASLEKVSYEQAIKHPKWEMGWKISIDSATLMNKCFEVIEAFWYFPNKKIHVLYHPESNVHAMIKFVDNSYKLLMSTPDMMLPIALALTNFSSVDNCIKPINFNNMLSLNFMSINEEKCLPIKWANMAISNKNVIPISIVLNTANEFAVNMFKNNLIKFNQILSIIDWSINNIAFDKITSFQDLYDFEKKIKTILDREYM